MEVSRVGYSAVYVNHQLVLVKQEISRGGGEILWVDMDNGVPEVYESLGVDEAVISALLAVSCGKIRKMEFCINGKTYVATTSAAIAFLLREAAQFQQSVGPGMSQEDIVKEIIDAIYGDDELFDAFSELLGPTR